MNKPHIFIAVLLGILGLASCGKDSNFPSTPDLEYKSIYPMDLSTADSVAITCSFRDKEGDLQGTGTLWYKANNITTPGNTTEFDDYGHAIPGFPPQNNIEGNIIVILKPTQDFSVGSPSGGGSDSIYFELYLKDHAGHISDTIRTDTVLVHNP